MKGTRPIPGYEPRPNRVDRSNDDEPRAGQKLHSPANPTKTQATARPWRVSQEHEEPEWVVIIGSDLSVVANVNSESGPDLAPLVSQKQPQNENAALIVQAVNEHDALCAVVESAAMMRNEIVHCIERGMKYSPHLAVAVTNFDAARMKLFVAQGKTEGEATTLALAALRKDGGK